LLIAEGGTPKLVKTAYLSDQDCARIAAYATTLRAAAKVATFEPTDTLADRPAAA
jgi:S-DNA-T family DNA segregation ATPase FtsK/SpoIIIE